MAMMTGLNRSILARRPFRVMQRLPASNFMGARSRGQAQDCPQQTCISGQCGHAGSSSGSFWISLMAPAMQFVNLIDQLK
jgi:hypothetical protein